MTLISPKEQQIIDALNKAVAAALERKRRLGQYAVIWRDGHPVILCDENTDMPRLPLPPGVTCQKFSDIPLDKIP